MASSTGNQNQKEKMLEFIGSNWGGLFRTFETKTSRNKNATTKIFEQGKKETRNLNHKDERKSTPTKKFLHNSKRFGRTTTTDFNFDLD